MPRARVPSELKGSLSKEEAISSLAVRGLLRLFRQAFFISGFSDENRPSILHKDDLHSCLILVLFDSEDVEAVCEAIGYAHRCPPPSLGRFPDNRTAIAAWPLPVRCMFADLIAFVLSNSHVKTNSFLNVKQSSDTQTLLAGLSNVAGQPCMVLYLSRCKWTSCAAYALRRPSRSRFHVIHRWPAQS